MPDEYPIVKCSTCGVLIICPQCEDADDVDYERSHLKLHIPTKMFEEIELWVEKEPILFDDVNDFIIQSLRMKIHDCRTMKRGY